MSSMRRAQRIVALEGEVVVRAIEWLEALEAFRGAEGGEAVAVTARAMQLAEDALENRVAQLRTEFESLAVPA